MDHSYSGWTTQWGPLSLAHDGFELEAWLKMNRNAIAFSVPHLRAVDVRTARRPRWAWTPSASCVPGRSVHRPRTRTIELTSAPSRGARPV